MSASTNPIVQASPEPEAETEPGLKATSKWKQRILKAGTASLKVVIRVVKSEWIILPFKLLSLSIAASTVVVGIWWVATADQRLSDKDAIRSELATKSRQIVAPPTDRMPDEQPKSTQSKAPAAGKT